jgi:hypothetical protein
LKNMKNQNKQMMAVPVLVLALAPDACGTLSPTSPDDMTAARGATPTTVASSGLKKPTRVPPPTCSAQALLLSAAPGNPTRITATFVDALGKSGFAADCALSWSVSPTGAHVVPVPTGTADAQVVDLVVSGANQKYTVTAFSGTLSASLDVAAKSPSTGTPTATGRTGPTQRVCLAEGLKLSTASADGLRLAARLADSSGLPVSSAGCSLIWSVSPNGAYVQPLQAGTADGQLADVIIVGARQAYTVTVSTNGLSASITVSAKSAGTPQ